MNTELANLDIVLKQLYAAIAFLYAPERLYGDDPRFSLTTWDWATIQVETCRHYAARLLSPVQSLPLAHTTPKSHTGKRTLRNPAAWLGKRIDLDKWTLPKRIYVLCRKTGKLMREDDSVTFAHTLFSTDWLIRRGIYIEDADWLSEEGLFEIYDVLKREGVYDEYVKRDIEGKRWGTVIA